MIAFVSAHTMRFTFVFTYVTLFYVCPHVLPMPTGGHCQGLGLDSMSVMGRPQNLVYIYKYMVHEGRLLCDWSLMASYLRTLPSTSTGTHFGHELT